MITLLKLVLKNIKANKARTFLIVFCIMLTTALCFSSISISDTMTKTFVNKMKRDSGNTDIVVQANSDSSSNFIERNLVKSKKSFEKIYYMLESPALYNPNSKEAVLLDIKAMKWDDWNSFAPIKLKDQKNLLPFTGNKAIISTAYAKKYNLYAGQSITIKIAGKSQTVNIVATALPTGAFDSNNNLVVLPMDFLNSKLNCNGKVTQIYIKLNDSAKKQAIISDLTKTIGNYSVSDTISNGMLLERITMFKAVLTIMLMLIILLSIFVIYMSFKLISSERLPLLGTLRSIGATKKLSEFFLMSESLIYGVIGGVLGSFLGIGILYLMAYITSEGSEVTISFSFVQFPVSLVLAIVLSICSSLLPIIRISTISVKDIILDKITIEWKSKKLWKLTLAVILIIFSFIVPMYISDNLAVVTDILCIVAIVIAIVLIIPYLIELTLLILKKVFSLLFGNVAEIAIKNLKDNKNISNNISLLAIGISAILLVSVAGISVVEGIVNFSKETFDYNITVTTSRMDAALKTKVSNISGVKDVMGTYLKTNVKISGSSESIYMLEGEDHEHFRNFMNVKFMKNAQKTVYDKLESGRYIVLSYALCNKYGKHVGDKISLLMNGIYRDYTIIDQMDLMYCKGSYAIISSKYFKKDFNIDNYSTFVIKTDGNSVAVMNRIKNALSDNTFVGTTVEEDNASALSDTSEILKMMTAISLLAIAIGIFGVFINLGIDFIQRKRLFAIYSSIGMSKSQLIKMIFIEAIVSGLIGGIVGIFGGYLMLRIIPSLTKSLVATIPMQYSIITFILALVSGIFITVVASISSAAKTSKMNLIEAITFR